MIDLIELIEAYWVYFPPILFVGFWVFVTYLISFIGGWAALGKYYPAELSFTGETFGGNSARLGVGKYGGCFIWGANVRGLYLAVAFIFRAGHPPLFIPWQDITVHRLASKFFPKVELEFSKSRENRLRISKSLAEKIAHARAGRLRL